MSPASVSVCVTTIPGQADHCFVGVVVGAKKSVHVGVGWIVVAGVKVKVEVADGAVVAVYDTSLEGVDGKSSFVQDIRRLHAGSRDTAITIKNMGSKYLLICMAASIRE
jgi:hypothetical protein